ncbi:MAG TPA: glycosyltransferase family 4 protein [Vicinamibacteria bacterium]|nr:glycosyltransferase family 4 protein [Vicinamibacteria bacterium]
MRVLHVAPFFEPAWERGGMARAAAGLARALAARGHEVTVVTTRPRGSPAEEIADGVRVLRWSSWPPFERRLVPWAPGLRRRIETLARGVDVGHVHGHRTGFATAASAAFAAAGAPYVLQPHGTYPAHGQRALAKRMFDRLAGASVVARAARLVAVSEAEARDLPRPATVVPNGVELRGASAARGARGQGLLFVGNDSRQKRGLQLVPLLAALPEARLDVVGAFGEGFRRVFAPVAGRVTWSGVLAPAELAHAYARADLVIHPAVGEAFGLVPFEAALCGADPVVAGDHGCGEWLRRAGGATVPPDDPGALLAAVKERLEDHALRQREADAVARFAARELTWESAARRTEALYADLLAARRRSVA